MADNIPWYIALPLAAILWVFLIRAWRIDARRIAQEEVEAARLAQSGDTHPAADRFLSDMGMSG